MIDHMQAPPKLRPVDHIRPAKVFHAAGVIYQK
jgi:hypothetical protein